MKPPKTYATYEESLEAERQRERQRRRTRQGAFEASMISFEETQELYYPLAAVMGSRTTRQDVVKMQKLVDKARKRVERYAPECLEVFRLILKNGKERQKSIWEMVNKIKRQHGALRKTRSTPSKRIATSDIASGYSDCSTLKSKTSQLKKCKNGQGEKS